MCQFDFKGNVTLETLQSSELVVLIRVASMMPEDYNTTLAL